MNQAHYDSTNIFHSKNMYSGPLQSGETWEFLDAENRNRLLACYWPRTPSTTNRHFIIAELHLDSRKGDDNKIWLLTQSSTEKATVVGARFENASFVEVWASKVASGRSCFVRFKGSRKDTSQELKPTDSFEWKRSMLPNGQVVSNSIDVANKRFVMRLEANEGYVLASFDGRVLGKWKATSGSQSATEIGALWNLTVKSKVVPNAKNDWIPLSRTADNQNWYVEKRSDGSRRILKV